MVKVKMESLSPYFGNFVLTSLKITIFNYLILLISSCANGISIEFQNTVGSETAKSHQIVHPNSGNGNYFPNQQMQQGRPIQIPSSNTLAAPSYKYTLAYIGQSPKSLHDKAAYNNYGYTQPKLVPTASGHYVQLANSISHPEQTHTSSQPEQTHTISHPEEENTVSHHEEANTISHHEEEEVKQYKYGYRVSDPHHGTEFGHSEISDGHTAKGYYHVLLPDGRLQTVEYWAGPSGYHATITYDYKH